MGVAPSRNPVFKSCEVVPALEDAIQTIAPTLRAIAKYLGSPVRPRTTKMRQVPIRVATAIPEFGQEEDPTWPVRREETTAKKKPNRTISNAEMRLTWSCGNIQMKNTINVEPAMTAVIGISRSVRKTLALCPDLDSSNCRMLALKELIILGMARTMLKIPPAVTAPAPIYFT